MGTGVGSALSIGNKMQADTIYGSLVVTREQMRHQYSSIEYLSSKAIAELPLNAIFSGIMLLRLTKVLLIDQWKSRGARGVKGSQGKLREAKGS